MCLKPIAGFCKTRTVTLPPELCDKIIDCLAPFLDFLTYTPDLEEWSRIRTLLACATVHRDWVPRSRIHLYASVWISNPESMLSLANTLRSSPTLGLLVGRLVVAPVLLSSLDQPIDQYISLRTLLSGIKCPTQDLVISNARLDSAVYPAKFITTLGAHSPSIIRLQLHGVILQSIPELLSLVHSFRNLVYLSLVGVHFVVPPTIEVIARMHLRRLCWAAASLRVLEVGGLGGISAVAHLFGNNIRELRIDVNIGQEPLPNHYQDCLVQYTKLESIRILIEPWASFQLPSDTESGARVWGPIHDYLLSILRAVVSPIISLEIALLPQQQDPEFMQKLGGPLEREPELEPEPEGEGEGRLEPRTLPCRYRHTRSGILDTLFASDVRDTLASSRFAKLAKLKAVVCENSSSHNEAWWSLETAGRLPSFNPAGITVSVRYSDDHIYDTLWEPDSVDVATTPPATSLPPL